MAPATKFPARFRRGLAAARYQADRRSASASTDWYLLTVDEPATVADDLCLRSV